jgi:acyl-CoA reductase-like NAD-dependent aldehyde dehydrogenase
MKPDAPAVGYATALDNNRTTATTIDVIEPATGRPFTTVAVATDADIRDRIREARAAAQSWRDKPAAERAALLLSFARRLREDSAALVELMAREGGKVKAQCEWEVGWTADVFEFYAGMARNYAGRVIPSASPTTTSMVIKEPLGVVALLLPWNYALLLWAWKAAPALAAGNCVLAKPSPLTPVSLLHVQERLGLPPGVHAVLIGGSELGNTLATHPEVDAIAFTGTAHSGKAVMRASIDSLKRIAAMELSGQDAMIIWDDVDVETAAAAAAFSGFAHSGQVCTSTERVYVRDSIAAEFTRHLSALAAGLKVGDPLDASTQLGPLMTASQRTRMLEYVERAKSRGGRIECGGHAIELDGGFYFAPTVISNVSHQDVIDMGEIFGPIIPVIPVKDFDEAIRLVNDSPYGLGASVLTADLERALQAARNIRSGTVWINSALMDNNAGPFGGFRQSGFGREMGEEGFEAYLQTKHVSIDHRLARQPWWF